MPESAIWTSALATAQFLSDQIPGGSAYAIGEAGLTTALYEAGYTLTESDPDYVVLGETRTYSFEAITKAVRLILGGARFICTNPDATGPSAEGPLPATGAVAAMITRATGREPYFVGKPNPMMFRSAQYVGEKNDDGCQDGRERDDEALVDAEGPADHMRHHEPDEGDRTGESGRTTRQQSDGDDHADRQLQPRTGLVQHVDGGRRGAGLGV